MSQLEILEEIKKLPAQQQREVVEAVMKLISDEEVNARREKERLELKTRMTQAAERLKKYYMPGSEHIVGDAFDEKDFYEQR
jgi:hypothetical protein